MAVWQNSHQQDGLDLQADCIDKKGIKPDFEVAQTTQTNENGEEIIIDTQLVKALEVIGAM